jgi:ArsR family transcriptional regulator
MNQPATHVLAHLNVLGDPLRARLLLVLDGQTLSVGELCDVLQLPQSTISRHLKTLTDGGWAQVRREGTSRLYSLVVDDLDEASTELWRVVKAQLSATPGVAQDRARLSRVVADRRAQSAAYFSRTAGQWDAVRDDLFGEAFHLAALLAVVDPDAVVADLGCGTGRTSASLAPFVRKVFAVDASPEMLAAAGQRLSPWPHVEFREGALETLPLDTASVDLALLVLVLHHVSDPSRILEEARRVVRPGGTVLVVDMQAHDRDEYRAQMGHVWLGFSEADISRRLGRAGFTGTRVVPLSPAPGVRGPALFVARATAGTHSSGRDGASSRPSILRHDAAHEGAVE